MNQVILIIGIVSLVLGLLPLPKYEPITKELRVHNIIHMKCTPTCTITDKEM